MKRYTSGERRGSASKKAGSTPVLYALDTTSSKMTGPRSTKVGMSSDEVLGKFRDLGHGRTG